MEGYSEDIDRVLCPSCGEGNEKGSKFCIHCGKSFPGNKRFRSANLYILAGAGLILVGVFAFLWMRNLESSEVGKVNGESISREEYSKRIDRAKKFYEYRYGQDLFQGEEGRENLNRLKTDIIDEMINEKILLQEAKAAGYTTAPEEEIEKQLEAIKKKNSLSDGDLTNIFGGSIEDFKAELKTGWVISQFVEKVVIKGNQANGNQLFSQWLTQLKARSKIETYEKLEPVSTAKASCCGSGGGCGGSGRAQALDPKMEQEARVKGLEYYEKKTQKKGASAKVTNFGCHIQVDIIEDGKVIVSLTYNQGEVQEI
jgi:SurA N-terminal domain/zinc-ribbon domain